jgi:cytidylate kinase
MQSYYRSLDVFHKNPQKSTAMDDSIGQYRTVKIDQSHRSRLQNFIERHRSSPKRDSQENYSSFFRSHITELESDCETSTELIVSSLKELDSKLQIKRDKSIDTKDEEISFSIDGKHFDSSNSQGSPPSRTSRTPDSRYRTPTKNIKRNTTFTMLPQESNSYSQIMTVRKYSDKIKSLDNLSKQLEKRKKELDAQEAVITQKLEELKWKEAETRDRVLAPERLREIERMLRYEELEIKGRLEAVIAREAMVEERERKLQEMEETDTIRRKLIFDTTFMKTPAFSLENSLSAPLQGINTEDSLSKLEAKLRETTIDLEARTFELIEKEKAAEIRVKYI